MEESSIISVIQGESLHGGGENRLESPSGPRMKNRDGLERQDLVSMLLDDSRVASILALDPNMLVEHVRRLCRRSDDVGTTSSASRMTSNALLQVLAMAPRAVEEHVLHYFESHPSPASLLLSNAGDASDLTVDDVLLCGESMMVGLYASSALCRMWDWCDVVGLFEYPETREYGKVCLGRVLNVRGIGREGSEGEEGGGEEEEAGLHGYLEWKEIVARKHSYRSAVYRQGLGPGADGKGPGVPSVSPASVASTSGSSSGFYPTKSQSEALWQLEMCLSIGSTAVSLEGPPSCGKSRLIEHLASQAGQQDFITIHLDDQMDSKALLGGYVCTAKPGEFVWAPGPVIRAMRNGSWLVLENANLASPEVVTMISSLAKTKRVEISARGETVVAVDGFRILATCTSFLGTGAHHHLLKAMLSNFVRIQMSEISQDDKFAILENLNPSMSPLLARALAIGEVLATGRLVQGVGPTQIGGAGVGRLIRVERMFTFRDMIKWAKRMAFFWDKVLIGMPQISGERLERDISLVPQAAREAAFVEFADCTCLSVSSNEARSAMLSMIAGMLALPESVTEDYQRLSKPHLSFHDGAAHIGRASIQSESSSTMAEEAIERNGKGAKTERSVRSAKSSTSGLSRKGPSRHLSASFAQTGSSMRLMERLSAAIQMQESILLVGETGVGKTTVIQEIAKLSDKRFAVVNLSQQTDSSDLIGGFRPKVPGEGVIDMMPEFVDLIKSTWKRGDNEEFLSRVVKLAQKRKWTQLLKAYKAAIKKWSSSRKSAAGGAGGVEGAQGDGHNVRRHRAAVSGTDEIAANSMPRGMLRKRQREAFDELIPLESRWLEFSARANEMEATSALMERGFAFGFTEGVLVRAFREGWWLLLDEINLAPTEVLERITGLLDSHKGWILTERGDEREIKRHPDFRIFGAMNPATDSGKKSLPPLVRDRFTEFWVDEPTEKEDLLTIVSQHLGPLAYQAPIQGIVDLYVTVKYRSMGTLQDGAGVRPVYNLRTLTRALEYARVTADTYGVRRSLVDGFAMSFQTQLDAKSSSEIDVLLEAHLLPPGTSIKNVVKSSPEMPSPRHILFDHYWVEGGDLEPSEGETFIATPTVRVNLRNLARAVLLKKYPILLQGPTSSGKTSLVSHLAAVTGHKCIRINNHEHTDIQEYIGTYMSDAHGRLVFNEGPLVQALRHGHWVILDELNLAPSEVLEALNRLLDDNRELFVPELQEMVTPHKHFMLFATQNPPGIYAGRKTLSRAFRSRFLELHVDDIPDGELHEIVEKRCAVAPSYAKKMIAVMRELQRRRSVSNVFAGRHGYITPRDLFRWANRPAIGYDELAANGFFVLAERLRNAADKEAVLATLERELKVKVRLRATIAIDHRIASGNPYIDHLTPLTISRTQIDPLDLYEKFDAAAAAEAIPDGSRIVWTPSFRRMCVVFYVCVFHDHLLTLGLRFVADTTSWSGASRTANPPCSLARQGSGKPLLASFSRPRGAKGCIFSIATSIPRHRTFSEATGRIEVGGRSRPG